MPADFETGFFVHEAAWHGLGEVHDDYPANWAQAREWAGLNWEPVKSTAYGFMGKRKDGTLTFDPAEHHGPVTTDMFSEIEGKSRIVRSDTGATLGVPSAEYTVINHEEMGNIVEAVLGIKDVKYETTIVLAGGKQVASLIRLDEPVVIPGDSSTTYPFMALTNAHDGTGSCRGQSTTIRVVCRNTYSAAEAQGDRNGTVFTFSHTKNWRDHIEEARNCILALKRDFAEYVEVATLAAKTPMARKNEKLAASRFDAFVDAFIPAPVTSTEVTQRVMNNILNDRAQVKAIHESVTCDGIRFTAFGAMQAAGEFLDHYRRANSKESKLRRSVLSPEERKTEIRHLAFAAANGDLD